MKKTTFSRCLQAVAIIGLSITILATTGCATKQQARSSSESQSFVTLNKSSLTLKVRETFNLSVTDWGPRVKHVTYFRYKSSNPSVATVDYETGLIRAIRAGVAEIGVYHISGAMPVPMTADGEPHPHPEDFLSGPGNAVCKVKVED
jgi:uncharacterized protein YjdB